MKKSIKNILAFLTSLAIVTTNFTIYSNILNENSDNNITINATAASNMNTGSAGINLIKKYEKCRLTAYKATSSEEYYTIGWGHYGPDVKAGMTITQEQADQMFIDDLVKYENYVNDFLGKNNINVTQNQFDALVSLTYNCGNIWVSTPTFQLKTYLINGVNNYTTAQITTAFTNWNKQNGKVLEGLTKRRNEEASLFLNGDILPTPILPGTIDNSYSVPVTVTADHQINTYDSYGNVESDRHIDSGDSCYIDAVYTNGFIHVEYPTPSGKRWTYAKLSDFNVPKKDTKWYSGLKPVDIGSEWYGYIINNETWGHLTNDGDNVSFRKETGKFNQIWKFTKNSDGSYRIINLADRKSLDVSEAKSESGTNVIVYEENPSDAQKWYIYGEQGAYYLRAACTDCALDLSGGVKEDEFYDGINAQMWEKNDSVAQKYHLWALDEAPKISVSVGNSATKTKFNWEESSYKATRVAEFYRLKGTSKNLLKSKWKGGIIKV